MVGWCDDGGFIISHCCSRLGEEMGTSTVFVYFCGALFFCSFSSFLCTLIVQRASSSSMGRTPQSQDERSGDSDGDGGLL